MKIKIGRFYRMRCGGAVKISRTHDNTVHTDDQYLYWTPQGKWAHMKNSPLDLVAEITEAEYNRIISGSSQGILDNSAFDTITDISTEAEVNELKAEIDRRERIATAFLSASIACGNWYKEGREANGAKKALEHADALIAALDAREEQK